MKLLLEEAYARLTPKNVLVSCYHNLYVLSIKHGQERIGFLDLCRKANKIDTGKIFTVTLDKYPTSAGRHFVNHFEIWETLKKTEFILPEMLIKLGKVPNTSYIPPWRHVYDFIWIDE